MTTNIDLTNRAIAQIGTRSQITSMVDGSAEALYANLIYNGLRNFLLREGDYDFALKTAVPTPFSPPTLPWVYSYVYPIDAIRLRQLVPTIFSALDPAPVEWNLVTIGTVQYIFTKTPVSVMLYTFAPVEDLWDALFTETFVRLLGSSLAFALENRIEASKEKLQEALSFAGIANMRDP